MAIVSNPQAAIPPGEHKGVIVECVETTQVFDPAKGPEPIVKITIQPEWKADADTDTMPVSVSFSPSLNGISALSQAILRLGHEIPPRGKAWEPVSLEGTEVVFHAETNRNGFIAVKKDSLRRAPARKK